jgi:hypothetical protein
MTDQPEPAAAPSAEAPPAAAASAPWHANIDQSIKDFWVAKKYDLSDPARLADVVSRSYQGAERLLGVPADELLRLPKANADSTEVTTFWNRVGVPKEAKDYDFSQIKTAAGEAPDQALVDALRTSLHANRVPKDNAPAVLRDVVKYLDGKQSEVSANATAEVQKQEQWLKTNWGARHAYNLQVAKDALDRFGQASGLTAQQTNQAIDALSKVGGIGAAYAMEMLRQIGSRMGEQEFVAGGLRPLTDNQPMSQEQAKAEIRALMNDNDFRARLLAGNVEAKRKWDNLHSLSTGVYTPRAVA